ncbi:PucR family transcriptional regulator [Acetobacterium sp. UBA5834]|jgi:hypothetical protein|uniref:PucR family transcriptional regulator n=1 Tax=Acetobacterium sp. UBA5834 TaxID=1945907 RepID=UPI00257FF61F|nr:helix-turn-helix domain-containing protein [Acetobacterium sp. UBA5834]
MELSLWLIRDRLGVLVTDYQIKKVAERVNFSRPVFYSNQEELVSDTLYMAMVDQLPENIRIQKDSALILVGSPPAILKEKAINYLVIAETVSIFQLSNKIHQIYDFFEIWDQQLQKGIREHQSLQWLLDLCEPVFKNGISIMNADYHIIARTSLTLDFNLSDDLKTDESGRLQARQVNSFKNDEAYRKIKDEKGVFIYPKNILPYRTLCQNIFHKQTFMFRIVIIENIHPFSESDAAMLEHLGKYFTEDSEYLVSINHFDDGELIALLNDMVVGKAYHQEDLGKALKRLGWELSDAYCVADVQPSDQDVYNQTLTYFCDKIRHDFMAAFAFIHERRLIVLFNLDRISNRVEYFDEFNSFIKESNFKVGYSHDTKGLAGLRDYYKEAWIARDFGKLREPQNHVYQFGDFVLDYLLARITSELPAKKLVAPVLMRLEDYDLENGSEYVKTLTVYLKNNMNALKTAKDLSIHRGTMVYRLDRIKEIGGIDFENPDELLHIHLSLKLMAQKQAGDDHN